MNKIQTLYRAEIWINRQKLFIEIQNPSFSYFSLIKSRQAIRFSTLFQELSKSHFAPYTDYPAEISVFTQHLQETTGIVHRLLSYNFLPTPFLDIIHLITRRYIAYDILTNDN